MDKKFFDEHDDKMLIISKSLLRRMHKIEWIMIAVLAVAAIALLLKSIEYPL